MVLAIPEASTSDHVTAKAETKPGNGGLLGASPSRQPKLTFLSQGENFELSWLPKLVLMKEGAFYSLVVAERGICDSHFVKQLVFNGF